MKIHKLLVDKTVSTLVSIFTSTIYADKAIEKVFKENRKWGSRDRRFFAEAVFDCVRFRRRYWSMAGLDDEKYLALDAINESSVFRLWLAYFKDKTGAVPEWVSPGVVSSLSSQKTFTFAIQQSYPDWIVSLFKESYPSDYESILKSMNEVAPVFIRVNEIKSNADQVRDELLKEGIAVEAVKHVPSALKLVEKKNVFSTQAFHKGYFEVQDAGSQMISMLLDARPGMRVVDACAGAGGKSLHLASMMKNKGKIISLDIHERRLKDLRTRATRNGVDIIEQKVIDSQKVIKRFENSFDRVLLDVPCTGLGVIRRNPDSKWKLTKDDLENLLITQQEILDNYSRMMKKDGKLVYATCSLFPKENELQVQQFLRTHPEWKLENEFHIRPDKTAFDGFYAACLVRQ
ncbi:MAG: methyltransferase domain-containing protein [Bdellovibrionaceae bacterium]|nr:methyltransferase domain-containing protein [Pseudobdellovibrionaceae bacterium]